MFITKKHVSRRTVLQGIGATIGLPLLEAMIPASTAMAATPGKTPTRFAFVGFPHGAIMDSWWPKETGTNFTISPILQPLEPFRKRFDYTGPLQDVIRARRARSSLSMGKLLGTHENELVQRHVFHGPRHSPEVAGMGGLDEHDANVGGDHLIRLNIGERPGPRKRRPFCFSFVSRPGIRARDRQCCEPSSCP